MKLIDNPGTVLKKAYSVRFNIIAAILGALELVLPLFETTVPRGTFVFLSLTLTGAAVAARVVAQDELHENKTEP